MQAAFAGEPGPLRARVSNTSHALRSLYVLTDRGVTRPGPPEALLALPHRGVILAALAATMPETLPFIG